MEKVLTLGTTHVFMCIPPICPPNERDAWLAVQISQRLEAPMTIVRRSSNRPALAPPHEELGISIAKSGEILVIAVDFHAVVGVDIEPQSAEAGMAETAQSHFNPNEIEAIWAQPENQRNSLALKLWVMKEAILKRTGRGVYDGLQAPDLTKCIASLHHQTNLFDLRDTLEVQCLVQRVVYRQQSYFIAVARP